MCKKTRPAKRPRSIERHILPFPELNDPEKSQSEKSLLAERIPSEQEGSINPLLAVRVLEALGTPLLICAPSLPDNPVIYANPMFEAVTGYPRSETLGRNCRFLQGQETDPLVVQKISAAVQEGRPFRGVFLNYGRDGTSFWNELDIAPIRSASGALTHFVGVQSDISERVQAQQALRAATTRLETLIASLQAGVIVEDDGGQVVLANQVFSEMMGLHAEALVGANVVPLARDTALLFDDPDGFIEHALHLRQLQEPVVSEELRLVDGRVWERDYVPVFPSGGTHGGHLWVFRDVTQRRMIEQEVRDAAVVLAFQKAELERANTELEVANARLEGMNVRLEELATTDGLTGLLNQRVFGERLAEEFRRARRYGEPLSLIVLDVDRFKSYNDSFGHLAGNSVLRELAEVLREHARETDLVARFGGEEFVLILPHTQIADAFALAERLRSAVEGRAWNAQFPITASFGVCGLTPEMVGPDALVSCADAALYHAKAGGRNQVA